MTFQKNPDLCFYTQRPELAEGIRKTLQHMYPQSSLKVMGKAEEFQVEKSDVYLIDTLASPNGHLEHLLDLLAEMPVLLIVPSLAASHPYREFITGRREMITVEDLGSMAMMNAIHHLVERQQLHEQLIKTAHRMKEMSIRDELTHLLNHRHFHDILQQEVKKANRYRRPLSIAIIELKHFEEVKKKLGHHQSEELLRKGAQLLEKTVRDVDTLSRYSDHLFAVIFPESDEEAAVRASKRIIAAFSGEAHLVISIGVAELGQKETIEELIAKSTEALKIARRDQTHSLCTLSDLLQCQKTLSENRQLLSSLKEEAQKISQEAMQKYFHALITALSEIPLQRQLLVAHAERVSFFAERLAAKIGVSPQELGVIHRAGLLHDIGKLLLSSDLIAKKDPISSAERQLLHQHPLFAAEILQDIPFLEKEREAIKHHHERFDGNGYPDSLHGDEIPKSARILAIAESWDAMTSPQPYRETPLSLDKALEELSQGSGTQFDPELAGVFQTLITGE